MVQNFEQLSLLNVDMYGVDGMSFKTGAWRSFGKNFQISPSIIDYWTIKSIHVVVANDTLLCHVMIVSCNMNPALGSQNVEYCNWTVDILTFRRVQDSWHVWESYRIDTTARWYDCYPFSQKCACWHFWWGQTLVLCQSLVFASVNKAFQVIEMFVPGILRADASSLSYESLCALVTNPVIASLACDLPLPWCPTSNSNSSDDIANSGFPLCPYCSNYSVGFREL